MLTIIVGLLLSFGVIDEPADYHNAPRAEQERMESIVIDDFMIA